MSSKLCMTLMMIVALSIPLAGCGEPDPPLVDEGIPEGNTEVPDMAAEPEDLENTNPEEDEAIGASVDVNTLEDEPATDTNP